MQMGSSLRRTWKQARMEVRSLWWLMIEARLYPIVIDPIVASLEQILDAGISRQLDARFGFAVAIEGDRAVVGAWREDIPWH